MARVAAEKTVKPIRDLINVINEIRTLFQKKNRVFRMRK